MVGNQEFSLSQKEFIIKNLGQQLLQHYVFLHVAEEMDAQLQKNVREGYYSSVDTIQDFCEIVTKDLYEICQDKHLKVIYQPEVTQHENSNTIQEKMFEVEKRRGKVDGYGFHKVERLPGNIGYIDMRKFYSIEIGADTVISAMNLVKNTDALILDLRKNGGGRVEMVAFFISYFLEEPTHINSIYTRSDDTFLQTWTQKYVPGNRYVNKPIYILTSNFTFSGGEALAYSLQQLKLAKIIGEVTGGGANPVIFNQVTENIRFKIPNRRTIFPITNSNWEGTGVIPDVPIHKEASFELAYKEALSIVRKKYANQQDYLFLLKEIDHSLGNINK
jgi:C-terminal processing protease CtpA/Prc